MAHKNVGSKKSSVSKKTVKPVSSPQQKVAIDQSLREQYEIIRNDILKLRNDIQKGYDMAKDMAEKSGLVSKFLKAK